MGMRVYEWGGSGEERGMRGGGRGNLKGFVGNEMGRGERERKKGRDLKKIRLLI